MDGISYRITDSKTHNGAKMVEVVVSVEGADGPTEVRRCYHFAEHEGYTVTESGKRVPKTGADYKAEIAAMVEAEFGCPKE